MTNGKPKQERRNYRRDRKTCFARNNLNVKFELRKKSIRLFIFGIPMFVKTEFFTIRMRFHSHYFAIGKSRRKKGTARRRFLFYALHKAYQRLMTLSNDSASKDAATHLNIQPGRKGKTATIQTLCNSMDKEYIIQVAPKA